jgi:hypothetical protein
VGPRAQLGHEARLADAGLAADEDEPPLAGPRALEGGLEAGERRGAPDERAGAGPAHDGGHARRRGGGGGGRHVGVGLARAHRIDQRPGLGRRRDAQVRAQPLAQALGGRERRGAIARRGQSPDERAPALLGERVQAGRRAAQADGRRTVARRLGAGCERLEPCRDPLALLVARREHPVGLQAGEQRAGAQGERLVGAAVGEQRLRLAGVHPVRLERDRVAVGREAARRRAERAAQLVERRAQARAGAGVEDVGPEPRGDRGAAVAAGDAARATRAARAPGGSRVGRGPPRRTRAEAPEHADAEHGDATLTLR